MSKSPRVSPRRLHWCAAGLLLLLTSCSQVPPTSSVVIPPVPAGGARIWIYRNEGLYESKDRPYLRLNGQIAGISEPNGAFYRDLPSGHYTVSVDSYGVPIRISLLNSTSALDRRPLLKSCRCAKGWAAATRLAPAPSFLPSLSRLRMLRPLSPSLRFTAPADPLRETASNGDGVNIAARIEALADAGGVFVSNTVHDHVRDRLPFVLRISASSTSRTLPAQCGFTGCELKTRSLALPRKRGRKRA
jgi:hypothetical protein